MNKQFDVIILAGGKGTRLRPMTYKRHKSMLKVCQKPILQWQIDHIKKFEPREIIISTGYRYKDIQKYNFGYPIYIDIAGTSQVQDIAQLKDRLTDNFFVIYGDLIFFENLKEMLDFHLKEAATATIKYHEKEINSFIGLYEDNSVCIFNQKPKVKTNSGIYLFNKRIFNYIDKDDKCFPSDIFPKLHSSKFYALPVEKYRISIDTKERLEKANNDLIE